MHHLRFRQVHLDFHTSPDIPGIGEAFDREKWQRQLRDAHVDSITCFSICHHGWSYHPTKVGEMHPHLKFDLLRAQFDACKQIDVNVPVYITAGFNQRVAMLHPSGMKFRRRAGGRTRCMPDSSSSASTPLISICCAPRSRRPPRFSRTATASFWTSSIRGSAAARLSGGDEGART